MRKSISLLFLLVFTIATMLAFAAEAQEKVELDVMFRADVGSMDRDKIRVDYFESEYPWIKINFETFPASIAGTFASLLKLWQAAGTVPDLLCLDFEPLEHVLNGMILPLDEFIKEDEKFQKWNYWHSLQVESFTYGGKIYALPRGTYVYGIWINCDLFDESAISYPKLGWTTDDFVKIGQKLTKDWDGDGSMDQYGYNNPGYKHQDLVSWYGKSLGADFWTYDEKTGWINGSNLNDPRIVESQQWFADLVTKYKISPPPELGDLTALGLTFALGRYGMDWGATWRIGSYIAEIGERFRYKFVPFPTVKPGLTPRGLLLQRPTGAIMSNCENPKEAWIFLREYSGYEQEKLVFEKAKYREYSSPSFKDSLILEDWLNQDPPGRESTHLLLELLDTDYPYPAPDNICPRGYAEWATIWREELEPVLRGKKTAQEAIDECFNRANATLVWDKETQEKIERFLGTK